MCARVSMQSNDAREKEGKKIPLDIDKIEKLLFVGKTNLNLPEMKKKNEGNRLKSRIEDVSIEQMYEKRIFPLCEFQKPVKIYKTFSFTFICEHREPVSIYVCVCVCGSHAVPEYRIKKMRFPCVGNFCRIFLFFFCS